MTGEVILTVEDLDGAVAAFVELGFRVDLVMPADAPSLVGVSGHGLHLRLERGPDAPARICLPGVTRQIGAVRIEPPPEEPALPPLVAKLVVSRGGAWHAGRAGMLYRDLLPGRLGGRFVASHIRIPDGGPVPDYVHFHDVRCQIIYCHRGWVRLVYEDQGPPFAMSAGDCVVQPPRIRHRVLEASAGLEVIEVGAPAIHATHADHAMPLPTTELRGDRTWDGQRFHHHRGIPGDLGIAAATGGIIAVARTRLGERRSLVARGELTLGVVVDGNVTLHCGETYVLGEGDAFAIPSGQPYELAGDGELLEVMVPELQR